MLAAADGGSNATTSNSSKRLGSVITRVRGWRGFHHRASLRVAAYGFLISEKETIPPLRTFSRLARHAICPSRRLQTQRNCRCVHNATCRTPSPRCVSDSHASWLPCCLDAPAAVARVDGRSSRLSDTVGLKRLIGIRISPQGNTLCPSTCGRSRCSGW
jgi:hypothetical protein